MGRNGGRTSADLGARANDVDGIYSIFPDVQDMWTFWRDQAPK